MATLSTTWSQSQSRCMTTSKSCLGWTISIKLLQQHSSRWKNLRLKLMRTCFPSPTQKVKLVSKQTFCRKNKKSLTKCRLLETSWVEILKKQKFHTWEQNRYSTRSRHILSICKRSAKALNRGRKLSWETQSYWLHQWSFWVHSLQKKGTKSGVMITKA